MLHTGRVQQPVPMTVTFGGFAHFILIFAAIMAVLRCGAETRKWLKFAGGGVLSLAYFALLVAIFKPH